MPVSQSNKKLVALLAVVALVSVAAASVYSAQVKPKPPIWVGIYMTSGKVGLKWAKAPGAARYKVFRTISSGRDYSPVAATTDVSYIDADVKPGETYYYALKTVDAEGGESAFSDERYVKVPVTGGGVPVTPPVWVGSLLDEKRVRLAWLPSPSTDALAYNVYRSLTGDSGFQLIGSTQDTNFTDTDVQEGRTYYYALTTLDKEFKETKFSEVRPVIYTLVEEPRPATGAVPGRPSGKPLEEAPEKVIAKPTKLVNYITRGKDDKPLVSPTDVDLSPEGMIYVTDSGTATIQVFKPGGEYLRSIGGYGKEDGKFEKLLGLDVDNDGNVYAVDAYTGRIQKFDKAGKLLMVKEMYKDGKAIARDLKLEVPVTEFGVLKVLVSDTGDLFVVDNFNHCIVKYSANGTFIKAFGGEGIADGKFLGPTFGAFDRLGNLYISDCFNSRVQVFNPEGGFLWKFGSYGNILGTFSRPKGIYIDKKTGRIYISDSMSNVVQVFDESGSFLFLLGDERGKQMDLGTPNGIVVDDKNRIYMVEKLVNRVQIRQVGEQ